MRNRVIELQDRVRVEFRKRKTMLIRIENNGDVLVLAPMGTNKKTLTNLLESKKDWVSRKRLMLIERQKHAPVYQLEDGGIVPFLGKPCQIRLIDSEGKHCEVERSGSIISVVAPKDGDWKCKVKSWYRDQARIILTDEVKRYRAIMNVKPGRIAIREQKTRWGSCSSKGNLNFNWKIVMAPLPVLEYLVLHEMCHLVHPNHSPNFWSEVRRFMPDYQGRRDWLKLHGTELSF